MAHNVSIYAYRRLRWLCGLGFGGGWRRCFVRWCFFFYFWNWLCTPSVFLL